MGMVLETPVASYVEDPRCLQGKSEPSAASGLLFSVLLPKGVGVLRIICPDTVVEKIDRPAAARATERCMVNVENSNL